MSTIGKILVIVTMVLSMTFMGISMAAYHGGPNWQSEFSSLPDYLFEKSPAIPGQKPTWSVKDGRTQEQINSGTVLPKVIIAAQQSQLQKQRDQIAALEQQIAPIEARTAEAKSLIEADLKALEAKEQTLVQELNALDQEIDELKQQGIAQTQAAFQIRETAELRREDVFRMAHFLDELRTDLSFAVQLQKVLRLQIVPIEINNQYLETRKTQLMKQTGAEGK
ncbi:MAG: hypothetical protein ACKVT0_21665 [Planctomycetaceae bacterium]